MERVKRWKKLLAIFRHNGVGLNKGADMIYTFETKDEEEIKVVIIKNEKGEIQAKAVKGVTQEELESIISSLWLMLQPSKN